MKADDVSLALTMANLARPNEVILRWVFLLEIVPISIAIGSNLLDAPQVVLIAVLLDHEEHILSTILLSRPIGYVLSVKAAINVF
jgi:uncharacterized membrane protein YciS (DUF1049 family)